MKDLYGQVLKNFEKLIKNQKNSREKYHSTKEAFCCLRTAEQVRGLMLINDQRQRSLNSIDLQLCELCRQLRNDHEYLCYMNELNFPEKVFLRGVELGVLQLVPDDYGVKVFMQGSINLIQLEDSGRP